MSIIRRLERAEQTAQRVHMQAVAERLRRTREYLQTNQSELGNSSAVMTRFGRLLDKRTGTLADSAFTHELYELEGRKIEVSHYTDPATTGIIIQRETKERSLKAHHEIDMLGLTPRQRNTLLRAGFTTINDLDFGLRYDLLGFVRNFGKPGIEKVRQKLHEKRTS